MDDASDGTDDADEVPGGHDGQSGGVNDVHGGSNEPAGDPDGADGGPDGAVAGPAEPPGGVEESADPTPLDRVTGIFLGSKLRILGTVILALILIAVLGFVLGIFGVPSVEGVDNQFGDVNESTTVIETGLRVHNPNPFGLKLGGSAVEYSVAMNDIRMAEGTYEDLGVGTGNDTLNFTSYMDNAKIPDWWASHVRNGERTTVEIVATARSSLLPVAVAPQPIERSFRTNITDAFNTTGARPINANQPLVSDPVLYLNETRGTWGEVTTERTEIDMGFTLYNPKAYPISASRIGYNMSMNDVYIGDGETPSSVTIPPGETREITATTTIRNQRLDQWWVSHLVRDQRTNLSIDFYAEIGSADTFGPIEIPLETMTMSFETHIFGGKAEGEASAGDGASGDGSTATATPGDDGGDTAIPTDDGVLGDSDTPIDDGSSGDGANTDGPSTDDGGSPTDESTPTDGGLFG